MPQDNNQKNIIIATVSFIIGFCLAWLITANRVAQVASNELLPGASSTDTSTGTSNLPVDVTTSTANSISVSNQKAGAEVTIDQVVLQNTGWVVIHEDSNGMPGKILGAQLFDPGTGSGTVELLRGTLPGGTYYAMLHSDNGDRAFDPKKDLPLTDQGGAPIMQTFQTLPSDGTSTN